MPGAIRTPMAPTNGRPRMIKTSLLIVLAMPLVWIACQEVQGIYESCRPVAETVKPPDDGPAILQATANAEAVRGLAESLRASVIRLDDSGVQTASSELAKALLDHFNARQKAREMVAAKTREAEVT